LAASAALMEPLPSKIENRKKKKENNQNKKGKKFEIEN